MANITKSKQPEPDRVVWQQISPCRQEKMEKSREKRPLIRTLPNKEVENTLNSIECGWLAFPRLVRAHLILVLGNLI